MKMKNCWLLSAAIIALSACFSGCSNPNRNQGSTGGSSIPPKVRSSKDVVRIGGSGGGLSAPGNLTVDVPIVIETGYHVNANPATFSYLIPTEVTVEKGQGFEAGKPIYPVAEKKKFQFADEPLAVYEGETKIGLPVRATRSGSLQLPVSVRVQACNQEECFPPDILHTTIVVEVK